jgi:hypothetical protein
VKNPHKRLKYGVLLTNAVGKVESQIVFAQSVDLAKEMALALFDAEQGYTVTEALPINQFREAHPEFSAMTNRISI